ncbi:hypothetical protein BGLA2_830031 [Burkholderia gladioli]|nr:hypothetical protein BGLA2_830031 [Burkholderia gladioli]
MEPALHRTTLVTLNMRELDRLKVIQAVVDTGLKPGRAAERLGVTVRQVQRLVERYRESGAAGLVSRKRDRPGNRRLDEELARRALAIIDDRRRPVGAAPATPAEGLPAAGAAGLPGRADPDRRQRASVVRGPGAAMHAAGVRRRRDQPADAVALHGD